jgi:hypothetical protein
MKTSTMRRVAPPVLAVVASLAFALPAPAGVRPDDRPGLHGTGAATGSTQMRPDDLSGVRVGLLHDSRLPLAQLTLTGRSDVRARVHGVGITAASPLRPDDRAGFRGIDLPIVAPTIADPHPGLSPRPDNRAGPLREPSAVASSAQPSVLGTDAGFDWAAAGAGAGSATGLILLLTGAALTLRRNHRRAATPA